MAQLVTELESELPYLDTVGLERHDAIDAVKAARAQHWLARTDMGYSVTRLQDVTAILRDKRFHSALSFIQRDPDLAESDWARNRRQSILTMEGDSHARLRRLVAPAFTPASANRLRPTMRSVVGDLFDRVA
jgi:cytochrome P450